MITKRNPIFRRTAWVGLVAALVCAAPSASAAEAEKQQVSEKVGEALQKIKPLEEAKNYAGMLALVDGLIPTVQPNSYDAAFLLDRKARILCGLEQYSKAIEPWEQSLKIAEEHGFFGERERQDVRKFLAQLIFADATAIKDKARQQQEIAHASRYIKAYLQKATKPEPETQMLYAQTLFYQAAPDAEHVNHELLQEAREVVERGMLGSVKPREGFYMLKLVILQQQNDMTAYAETMELMLKQYPNKKDAWPMLFGAYVNLGGTAKQENVQREYYIRAINTLERAQALGFMNTPRDNFNLVTLYLNAGQFSRATDILHEGMRKGTIESTVNNWRILGAYYQQANRELQAISALQEATKLFPKEGSLDLLIGQIYSQLDKTKDAYEAYSRAVQKGNLGDKPHLAYLYLAYAAFELGKYDEALKVIEECVKKFPEAAKDSQVKNLKDGIEAMIADREAAKAAAEAAAKKL